MDLIPDSLLNHRYRIERKLGEGGMGAVYLAMDTALDTWVAVKFNRNPGAQSTSQFMREARLLASLHHPNLPRVTDYFVLDDAQYLVMDYIDGRGLGTVLKEEGAQPLNQVLEWIQEIGNALSFLHHQEQPVIHRDIKPANVRLTAEGHAVLVDFGIAKIFAPDQATTTGAMGYTPGYAPPEQYGGAVRTGPYTDQYALAALLYHLLTGQKPADSVQRALGNAALKPIRAVNQAVPIHIQSAVEKALALKPDERFPDIDDFLRALSAPPPAVTSSVKQSTKTAEVQEPEQRAPSDAAQPAAKPRRSPVGWILGGLALVAVLAGGGYFLFSLGQNAAPTRAPETVVAAAAATVSETPRPSATASTSSSTSSQTHLPATATLQPPSQPPQPSPTETVPPSQTPVPPTSTSTPNPVGGGVIAFSSSRGDGKTLQIWTMRLALNDQGQVTALDLQQLTHSPIDKRQPCWSPDGSKLVYIAAGASGMGLDLWVMNADGSGEPVDLTHMKGDETEPAWSPDGRWIAFTNDGREDKNRQVYLIRPDGSDFYKLSYDQEEFGPGWTPDRELSFVMNASGAQIVFIRGLTDPKTGETPERQYYVTPVRFDKKAFTGNLGQAAEPAWSPDGQWLAYTREEGSRSQIGLSHYPVNLPEKDVIRLTALGKDRHPAWSPDGQWIVFTSERDGNREIYVMRSTGQLQSNVSLDPGIDEDPAWLWVNQQ